MPRFTCPTCGQGVNGDDCPACHAIAAGEPASQVRPGKPASDESVASIHKEYHQSFLRIFVSFFLIWTVLIGVLVFFAWLGAGRAFAP